MATKQVGLGALVKVDDDGDASFTTVGLTRSITPPPRSRALVDGTALEDDLAVNEAGIEEASELSFTQFWHPGDTNHEIMDTLFGSKAKVDWQIVYPFATPVTDEFEGFVSALAPEQIEPGNIISRQVTVQRTGAITRT